MITIPHFNSPQVLGHSRYNFFFWPNEPLLQFNGATSANRATNIHSHPIPCAFSVLQGVVREQTYTSINQQAFLKNVTDYKVGEGSIDLLDSLFVHRLSGLGAAYSLHIYGAAPDKIESLYTFKNNFSNKPLF